MDLTLWAPAKVNLFLEVLRKRADGYHEVQTLLQHVDLCDEIRFAEGAGIVVETGGLACPGGEGGPAPPPPRCGDSIASSGPASRPRPSRSWAPIWGRMSPCFSQALPRGRLAAANRFVPCLPFPTPGC